MSSYKCDVCGGNLIFYPDSAVSVCDSCGNKSDFDKETADKYKSICISADRKMRLNSKASYSEAIDLLNDIRFVDGVEEKIQICYRAIAEIESENAERAEAEKQNDAQSTRIGIVLIVSIVMAFLLLTFGVGYLLYKIVKGECTLQVMYICIGLLTVSVLTFFVGKIKG